MMSDVFHGVYQSLTLNFLGRTEVKNAHINLLTVEYLVDWVPLFTLHCMWSSSYIYLLILFATDMYIVYCIVNSVYTVFYMYTACSNILTCWFHSFG